MRIRPNRIALGALVLLCSSILLAAAQDPATPAISSTTTITPTTDNNNMPTTTSPSVTPVDSSCVFDPTTSNCTDFKLTDEMSNERIDALCQAMPFMIGCTLRSECQNGEANGQYCSPFSILADICIDMPTMTGCDDYVIMCNTPGSVIKQCLEQPPIPGVLTTKDTAATIQALCSTMPMEGCEECTSATVWPQCPDPLGTISKLCVSMPDMPDCADFNTMCNAAETTFNQLCTSDGGSSLPPMKMYLHASTSEIILIKSWVPTSFGTYVASCLAVIAAAILVQYLKAIRVRHEVVWAARSRQNFNTTCGCEQCMGGITSSNNTHTMMMKQQSHGCGRTGSGGVSCSEEDDDVAMASTSTGNGSMGTNPMCPCGDIEAAERQDRSDVTTHGCAYKCSPHLSIISRNTIRSIFTMIVVFLDYMLMLIVMTFNIGLIVSAVVGFGIGALAFGHMGEYSSVFPTDKKGRSGVVVLSTVAPEADNDLEVQFVDPQTCCNSRL